MDPTELESVTFAMSMQRSNQTELRIQNGYAKNFTDPEYVILPKYTDSNNDALLLFEIFTKILG